MALGESIDRGYHREEIEVPRNRSVLYIIVVTGVFRKNRMLHLTHLHGFGGCTMKSDARKFHLRAVPNTKEILAILSHFSSPQSITVKSFQKADFS